MPLFFNNDIMHCNIIGFVIVIRGIRHYNKSVPRSGQISSDLLIYIYNNYHTAVSRDNVKLSERKGQSNGGTYLNHQPHRTLPAYNSFRSIFSQVG